MIYLGHLALSDALEPLHFMFDQLHEGKHVRENGHRSRLLSLEKIDESRVILGRQGDEASTRRHWLIRTLDNALVDSTKVADDIAIALAVLGRDGFVVFGESQELDEGSAVLGFEDLRIVCHVGFPIEDSR